MADTKGPVLRVAGRGIAVRAAELREILALRHAELRPGLPLATAQFGGDGDPATRHFGAFDVSSGEALGCASFMAADWEGEAARQLRGMATRGDLVGRGIGAALLNHAEAAMAAAGATLLWCNARIAAVPFYHRQGWAVVSEPFDIPGVGEHRKMLKRLTTRPVL